MHLVDFHAHILPNADHGSSSLECSMKQVAYAMRKGIREIVATPHFYPHRHDVDKFLQRRKHAYKTLTHAVRDQYGDDAPKIRLGAEVLLCPGIENLGELDALCIEGTRVLLLELPFHSLSADEKVTVSRLIKMGYTILLAHVDRYQAEDIEFLVAKGARMQLNAEALSHFITPAMVASWIEQDLIYALGSDIHDEDDKAYARFVRAERKLKRYLPQLHERARALLQPTKARVQ